MRVFTRLTCVAAAGLLAACTTGAKDSREVPPIGIVGDPHVSCMNGSNAALEGRFRTPGQLTGDVDGDGHEDRVWMSTDPSAEAGCKSFLTVETDDTAYWAAADPSGTPRALQVPTLNSLSEINTEPGAEVVVNLETGASTQFVGVFTLTRAGLERVTVDGKGPGPFAGELDDLFAFGGSVGHLEGIDCTEDGLVVMSAAFPEGGTAETYSVERRFFHAARTTLILDKALTERQKIDASKVGNLPELGGSPFLSCD